MEKPFDQNLNTPENKEQPKKRILIADDDKDQLDLYLMYFDGMGHTIDIVNNGQELLDKLKKERYDLVITDNNMPVVTGLEAIEKIRADEKLKNLPRSPIILCSAAGSNIEELKRIAEENGAVFFSKSDLNMDNFKKIVETALAEARDQKIKAKLLTLYSSNAFEKVHAEIVKRAEYLEKKYKNLRDYIIFHALVGSSIRGVNQDLIEGDLPGDDSIEKFADDLYKKYKK